MAINPLPSQEELRGNADPLLRVLAERIVDFRENHLHEGSDYLEAITNGQKPLAFVSQCIDSRQPVHMITGLPLGKIMAQSSIAGYLHDYPDSLSAWAGLLFSIKVLGTPIVIKLGHTGCGGAEKLVDICLEKPSEDVSIDTDHDPTLEWLQSALPLTKSAIKNNPGLSRDDMAYVLEEELVRDGIKKLNHFLDDMVQQGHLPTSQRPVVVGLLFEMHTARLHHLQPNGEFIRLSKSMGMQPREK
jgi:carbonic anhydrase